MVLQARRAPLASGKFGAVSCFSFDPCTGRRCGRFAGMYVFCSLPNHAAEWETLTEAQQVQFNELLTNPAVAHDTARWAEIFEQYRNGKAAVQQAAAVRAMADAFASGVEQVAAAKKTQEDSVERARQRVAGALRSPRACVRCADCTPAQPLPPAPRRSGWRARSGRCS
jgi:hypothetical protein